MSLVIDNTANVVDQLETTVTTTTRTVTAADPVPVGAAGVDTRHASFITLGVRNVIATTVPTLQVWGLVGNEWIKLQGGSGFSVWDPKLIGPLEIRGADRVFLQVASFTGTSLEIAYMVHNPVAPSTLEARPEVYPLDNSSSAAIPTQGGFQVFVPYTSNSLGEAVENDVGLNAVLTIEREDTGEDGDDVTTGFSLTTSSSHIVDGFAGMITVIATVSGSEVTMSDDGAGNLSGPAGTGTVTSYAGGTLSVTFSTAPDNLTDILITYTVEANPLTVLDVQQAASFNNIYDFDFAGTPTSDKGSSPANLTVTGTWTNAAPSVIGTQGSYENLTNGSAGNRLHTAVNTVSVWRTADVYWEGIFELPTTPGGGGITYMAVVGEWANAQSHSMLRWNDALGYVQLTDPSLTVQISATGLTAAYLLSPTYIAVWWDHSATRFRLYYRKAGQPETALSAGPISAGSGGSRTLWISGDGTRTTCKMKVHMFGIHRAALTSTHRNNIYAAMGI